MDQEQGELAVAIADQDYGVMRPLGLQQASELGDRGGLDDRRQGQLHPELGLDTGEEVYGQEGIPAQGEVIVIGPDGLALEQLGPQPGHLGFRLGSRWHRTLLLNPVSHGVAHRHCCPKKLSASSARV